jgi:hypothetical protein
VPVEPTKTPKRKLRWFQFSLRTLLVFVTLIGIACSWVGIRIQKVKRQEEAVQKLWSLEINARFASEFGDPLERRLNPEPAGPQWLRYALGEHFFDTVNFIDAPDIRNDDDLPFMKELTDVKYLVLTRAHITQERLKYIQALPNLQSLFLNGSTITDQGLCYLRNVKRLKILDLGETQVTDAGLANLDDLPELWHVDLEKTSVSETAKQELIAKKIRRITQ